MRGDSTKAIHEGFIRGEEIETFITPIYQTTVFSFPHPLKNKIRGRDLKYSREDNPTVYSLERRMASLEGLDECLAFSSGMAAISTLFFSMLEPGDELIILGDVYGLTLSLARSLAKFGVVVKECSADPISFSEAVTKRSKLAFVEAISNPLLNVPDIPRLSKIAEEKDCLLVVDNTFATPINYKPSRDGVKIVVHSGTKYLSGHNDVTCGLIICDNEFFDNLWNWRKMIGGVLDPHAAYLMIRGLKTLKVRVKQQNESAARIAEWLSENQSVEKTHYPGLKTHPSHEVARRILSGFGGVVSFEVKGGREEALRVVENVELIKRAPSLGGAETLIVHPASSSHKDLTKEEREKLGIRDNLLRLAVGLEEVEDLIHDLDKSLSLAVKKAV